jgi:hypothetical protein
MQVNIMEKYRAEYRRQGDIIRTRFYPDREQAQDALAKRIGHFHYLGRVSGDGFESSSGKCENAPRNGGLVSIESREI